MCEKEKRESGSAYQTLVQNMLVRGDLLGFVFLNREVVPSACSERVIWDQQGIAIQGLQPWRILTGHGKENSFTEGEGSWEDHSERRVHGFSLAESFPGKVFLPPVRMLSSRGVRAPPAGLLTLFN